MEGWEVCVHGWECVTGVCECEAGTMYVGLYGMGRQIMGCFLLHNVSCLQVLTWPGQQQQLNLVGIDQLGNPTYFIIRLSDGRSNINSGAFTQAGDDLFFNSTSVSRLLVCSTA